MFDIQKFADEEVESAENVAENFSIPEELEGISEEVAREVMADHAEKNAEPEEPAEPAEPEFDEEGNYTGEGKVEDVKIDYARYKETLDKQKDFEKQLKAYQEKFGDINAQPVPQQYQQPQYQQAVQEQKPPEPRYFTADDAKQIDDEITKTTIEMTGLTQDDIEQLDYLDDDDPKLVAWNRARKIAEFATYNNILIQQQLAAQENYRRSMMMNQSQTEFDNYVSQQKAAADFVELQNFVEKEFFPAQSDINRAVILDANSRIGSGTATPYDHKIVQDFFTLAQYAYNAKKQQMQTPPPVKPQKKTSPKPQFPRSEKVNGIAGSGGGVSNESLAEMMRTKDWDKIPPEYRKRLMGY